MRDEDRRIVVLACKICLEIGAVADVNNGFIDLLPKQRDSEFCQQDKRASAPPQT
jgi:hypothetical protein